MKSSTFLHFIHYANINIFACKCYKSNTAHQTTTTLLKQHQNTQRMKEVRIDLVCSVNANSNFFGNPPNFRTNLNPTTSPQSHHQIMYQDMNLNPKSHEKFWS